MLRSLWSAVTTDARVVAVENPSRVCVVSGMFMAEPAVPGIYRALLVPWARPWPSLSGLGIASDSTRTR